MLSESERILLKQIEKNTAMSRETRLEDLVEQTGHNLAEIMQTLGKLSREGYLLRKRNKYYVDWHPEN